ncbi:MAG: DUF3160 domain-containing protein [Thermodesulfobacteriota bacterium]|nr:DUF3160 domain-containing protein [Thermodesulfobacteriota bacterium]
MRRLFTVFLFTIIFLLIGVPGGWPLPYVDILGDEQEKNSTKPEDIYHVEQLNRDKILITRQSYQQIFEPYLNPNSSIFITSDTVLSAFHVLFAQSIADMEQVNANRALDVIKLIWREIAPPQEKTGQIPPQHKSEQKTAPASIKEKSAADDLEHHFTVMMDAARKRAQIIIAVAVKLLGDTDIHLDEPLNKMVENEVNKIILAEGIEMPEWTGVSDSESLKLDYSIFRPRGLYQKSELLRRYFRILTWFQSIPFRVENDEELLSILILGKSLNASYADDFLKRKQIEKFFRYYRELTGQPNDWDLLFASQITRDRPGDLEKIREYLVKKVAGSEEQPEIDHRFGAVSDNSLITDFRIISPFGIPHTVLFEQIGSLEEKQAMWPGGLGICVAIGSDFAVKHLLADDFKDGGKFFPSANDFKPIIESESLYNRYLRCLAALIDDAEHDAPEFMRSRPWQVKSCNTVLSGWVQFRHAMGFHTGENVLYTVESSGDIPSGFVEPDPEFFERQGSLVEDIMNLFERSGAFIPPKYIIAKDLKIFAGLIKHNQYPQPDDALTNLSEEEISAINRSMVSLRTLGNIRFNTEDLAGKREEIHGKILLFADDIINGRYDDEPDYHAFILETNLDTRKLWMSLRHMCKRLEVLAHKQLRGANFSKKDHYFLTDFGEKLAAVMLCDRYGYHGSNGAASQIVSLYCKPGKNTCCYSGIGRPRLMYVLYPYKGKEILCTGAVIPYYEFVSPTGLTDEQWQKSLDGDEPPETPVWLKPIITP